MKTDISLFILACQQLLAIETPVSVEYRAKAHRKYLQKVAAYCWDSRRKGVLVKFRLVINCRVMIESNYDSFSVIAHEFVHAKMIENGTFNPLNHHCETFQKICKQLEKCLKKAGFPIAQSLYNPETDDSGQ